MLFRDVVKNLGVGPLVASALVMAAYLGAMWAMLGQLATHAPAL